MQNMRHPAFPRGPRPQYYPGSTVLNFPRGPRPQYYPGSTVLNFAVRMESGDPRLYGRI